MANHIKNRLLIKGTPEEVKSIFDKYNTFYPATLRLAHNGDVICKPKNSEGFNVGSFNLKNGEFSRRNEETLIGLPEDWGLEISQPINHFPDFEKIVSPPDDLAYKDIPSQKEVNKSPNWWYNWNLKNWGTKWNSYDNSSESYNSFLFNTAWNGVLNLMIKISEQNNGIWIYYQYASEDTGYNCAEYIIFNGEVHHEFTPIGGSIEAYELAFKLYPENKENYVLIDGKYRYKED